MSEEDCRLLVELYNGDAQFCATALVAAVFAQFSVLQLLLGKGSLLCSCQGQWSVCFFVLTYVFIVFIGCYFVFGFMNSMALLRKLGTRPDDPEPLTRLHKLDRRLRGDVGAENPGALSNLRWPSVVVYLVLSLLAILAALRM